MKVGMVKSKNYVILILGFAGAGKTHVLHLLLGEAPPPVRISTPLVQSPVRAISQSKARMAGRKWKRVRRDEQSLIVAENVVVVTRLARKRRHFLETVGTPSPSTTRSQNVSESGSDIWDRPLSALSHSDTLEEVAEMIEKCSGSHQAIEVTWFNLIDSGGQPQFLEALPFFLPKRILHVLVQKLNERLRDHPKVELFETDGTLVTATPYTSTLSNEQILCHCIRSVQSSGSSPRLAIVGTHRDLAERECPEESLADKNKRIAELLPCAVKQHAIKYGEANFIIPVNAKNPELEDERAIAGLRQSIEDISVDEVSIPLQWYGLELAIQQLVDKFDRGILKVSEFEQETKALHLGTESLHEGLIYLDKLNIIHYYPELLPGIVFCSSQVLVDKISELVKECYRLRGEVQAGRAVNGPEVREFCNQGLVTRSRLCKLCSHYIPGVFGVDDFLRLFSNLFLITKVSEDKYLMPCLLPMAEALTPSVPQPVSDASISPLLLYFPNGGVRLGVFCAFLSYLHTEANWKLFGSPGHPVRIFRNSATFVPPGEIPCQVTVSDSMSDYLHIAIEIPSEIVQIATNVPSMVCPEILQTITIGLELVAQKMRYSSTDLESRVAFFCHGDHPGGEYCESPHPAVPAGIECHKWLTCCNDHLVISRFGSEHEVWFVNETGKLIIINIPNNNCWLCHKY